MVDALLEWQIPETVPHDRKLSALKYDICAENVCHVIMATSFLCPRIKENRKIFYSSFA